MQENWGFLPGTPMGTAPVLQGFQVPASMPGSLGDPSSQGFAGSLLWKRTGFSWQLDGTGVWGLACPHFTAVLLTSRMRFFLSGRFATGSTPQSRELLGLHDARSGQASFNLSPILTVYSPCRTSCFCRTPALKHVQVGEKSQQYLQLQRR